MVLLDLSSKVSTWLHSYDQSSISISKSISIRLVVNGSYLDPVES